MRSHFELSCGSGLKSVALDATVRPSKGKYQKDRDVTDPEAIEAFERDVDHLTLGIDDMEEQENEGEVGRAMWRDVIGPDSAEMDCGGERRDDGGRYCEGRERGKRMRIYTEWRLQHGEEDSEGEVEMLNKEGEAEAKSMENVDIYAMRVSGEEMEEARQAQRAVRGHRVQLGCCEEGHYCQRLKMIEGGKWMKICYAPMDLDAQVIGIYLYEDRADELRVALVGGCVGEGELFGRTSSEGQGDKRNTVESLKHWCLHHSRNYRMQLRCN